MTALTDLQLAEGLIDRNPAEALRLTSRVLAKVQKENQLDLVLQTRLVRGKVFSRQSEFSEALTEQMEALRVAEQIPDQAMQARCHMDIGYSHKELGQHVQAMESFEHSIKLFRLFKDPFLAAQVQYQMAVVWGRIGEHTKALSLLESCLPQLRTQADSPHHAQALAQQVWLQLEQLGSSGEKLGRGGLESALGQLEQALSIAHKLEDKPLERQVLLVRAKAHHQAGKTADAQFVLEQVLKQARAVRDIPSQMLALWGQGLSYHSQEQAQRALEPLLEALKLAQGHKHHQLPQLHLLLSQIYEQIPDPAEALRHFKVFYQLNSKTAAPLQEHLQVEDLKQQLETLKQETQQQRNQIEELTLRNRQLELQAKTLHRHASQDALTGLPNRYHLEHRLNEALEAHQDIVVMVSDIDRFKDINRSFGRSVGDKVLKAVAQIIQQQARGDDVVAQLSAEEIAVLLYGTDTHRAQVACERMRQAVEQFDWSQFEPGLKVTISLGYALAFEGNDVLEEAHGYLLEAKNLGGNRVYPARKQ